MTLHTPQNRNKPDEPTGSGRAIAPLRSLRSHWLLAIAALLGILLLGLPVAWQKGRPKWQSEGVLFVSPRFLRNLDNDQEHELQSNSQYREFVQQQVRTVNRFDIVQAVVKKHGALWRKPDESIRQATDRLRGALVISPVPDTYQVTVSMESEKAEGLAELLNAVMESYVRVSHQELIYDSDSRYKTLNVEKDRLDAQMATLTDERTEIAARLGTTVFNGSLMNSFDREFGSSLEALSSARRERVVAEAALTVKDAAAGIEAAALQTALNDASLNGYKSALTRRRAELVLSSNGLSAQHNVRIAAEKETRAIDRELESVTLAFRDRLAGNLELINRAKFQQSEAVESQLRQESDKIRERIDDYSRHYQRSLEINEEMDRLRRRVQSIENRMDYLALETRAPGFVRVFSPALKPEFPFAGGRKKLFLMVLAAAFVLAAAVPIGIDYIDPRLKAPRELERHLGLPISGWLWQNAAHDEAALLRMAISVRRHLGQLRHPVVVVTSIDHGSGATTISLGLASALNRLGTRTLVVEANPLTPDKRYGDASGGLIPWLQNAGSPLPVAAATSALPDRVATGSGSVADILPVEPILTAIDGNRDRWDLVIVDAAPLTASIATEELVRLFGAALLVVDSQRDKKKAVTECLNHLERLNPHAFGAVLNKVQRTQPQESSVDAAA